MEQLIFCIEKRVDRSSKGLVFCFFLVRQSLTNFAILLAGLRAAAGHGREQVQAATGGQEQAGEEEREETW